MATQPRYLVSTRVLVAGVQQPLPAGSGVLLIGAGSPESLFITIGEQSTPQKWGFGVSLLLPNDAAVPSFIMTSSADGDTVTIMISQGGLIAADTIMSLLNGTGERVPARGSTVGALYSQNITFYVDRLLSVGSHNFDVNVGAGASYNLVPAGIFTCNPRSTYVVSIFLSIASSVSGLVKINVIYSATFVVDFYVKCVAGTITDYRLENIAFSLGPMTGVGPTFVVGANTIGQTFSGSIAGTVSEPVLVK